MGLDCAWSVARFFVRPRLRQQNADADDPSATEMSIRPDLIRKVIPSSEWPQLAERTGVDLSESERGDGEWVMDLGEMRCEID